MGDGSPRLDGGHLGETVRTAHSSQREKNSGLDGGGERKPAGSVAGKEQVW